MNAGNLNRRLILRPASFTTDAMNERVPSYPDGVTVWAEKLDVSDGERVTAAQVGATYTARFRLRYSAQVAALTPLDRVYLKPLKYGETGREYEVNTVKDVGDDGLEISATARTE